MKETSMMDGAVRRREVLFAAALAPAMTFRWGPANAAASGPAGAVFGAVFDSGVPQSLAFAERTRSMGLRSFGFAGDMSSVWFDQLLPALRAKPAPLIGLTTPGALFCFEQLAWEAGMRVGLRIDHREGRDGVEHLASAPLPADVRAQLGKLNRAFGSCAADVAIGSRAVWGDCTHAVVPTTHGLGASALVTWVIAPLKQLNSA
jgi:hypothetical protein